jgi:hypothetical protein
MAAKMALPGTYVFRFAGFDRDTGRARHVTGLGQLVLVETGGGKGRILNGLQQVTNSPMSGMAKDLQHGEYTLSGEYTVVQADPPIVVMATVTFKRTSGTGIDKMTDTFAVIQSGPDRLWVMSTGPREGDTSAVSPKTIEELVFGELIKVDVATW